MKKTRNIYITFIIFLICISFFSKDFLIIHAQIAPEDLAIPVESTQSAELDESVESLTPTTAPTPTLSLEEEIEKNGFVEGVMSELNTLDTEKVVIDFDAI